MRRLTSHPVEGLNSMYHMYRAVPWYRVVRNVLVIYAARFTPWLGVKNWMYRLIGVKVGHGVSVGLAAVLDVFWPELITLEDNCIVGYNTTVLCHEFLQREYRTGPVVIGRNVMVGANCTILAGTVIGQGAVVSAMSLVNRDLPPGCLAGGVPARVLRTAEDLSASAPDGSGEGSDERGHS
ncbi:MAG: acyltransferase [Bacillota bacterium]